MDDLSQAMGGIRPQSPIEEAWHNEQRRKQYDIIRVNNPTNEDFYVMYDVNQYQKVPANSKIDVPRYIATRYITHMKDRIINAMIADKHQKDMEERDKKGFPGYKSKWEENQETYMSSSYPKTDDPKLMTDVIDGLWVGLVYEFGRDIPPENVNPRSGEVDLTPPEMRILENLDKRRVDPSDTPVRTYQPTYTPPPSQVPVAPPSSFSQMNERLSASDVTNE